MNGLSAVSRSLRRPSKRVWALLVVLVALLALAVPFQPYDWFQRPITAALNAKAYQGNGVIVAIDEETRSQLPDRAWTKSELAKLLLAVSQHQPKQIQIAQQYFDGRDEVGNEELASALAALPEKPGWQIELAADDIEQEAELAPSMVAGQTPAAPWVDAAYADLVFPTATGFRIYSGGAPATTFVGFRSEHGIVPSDAYVLAPGAGLPSTNEFELDASYDPRTVPKLSAIDVMNGLAPEEQLRGKNIIIAFTDTLGRDTGVSPHDSYAPRAALSLIAAQTLIDGPPRSVGWVPAFLIALLAALAWLLAPRPYGRVIAGVTFLAIFLSPIWLERSLIFQLTSNGLALLVLLGIGKIWQRGREAISLYRSAAETKSRFLAQASHDLRQPIHAIGLLADRLSQTDLSSDQQEIVSKISWSVDNARRMFRALLDIAAIESGTLQKDMGSVSVNELLAEVDSQNALAAEQAGVDLRLIPSDLVVITDRALLGTMLQNLVSNSIRYSTGGKVVVGCRRKQGRLAFVVADNGRGIAPDELEAVQREFYRAATNSSLGADNKGLGLAIVNRLARLLGLRFALRSKLGKGTMASIEGLRVETSASAPTPAVNDRKLPLAGVRVVVADDEEETLESTAALLERWGCDVTTVGGPPKNFQDCDIVLSDFDFGEFGTLAEHSEVLSRAKKVGARFIIVSGHHPDQIRNDLPDHTGLILTKPLRAAQLRSAIMSLRS